jgi:colanic acid/amylovoran biosynthesis glycosyltransferase
MTDKPYRADDVFTPEPLMTRIGYCIPEFPGQTHVWMWREITHLRQWGVPITLFSTRRPPDQSRARHAFAEAAAAETIYLWPAKLDELFGALLWAAFCHPIGFLKAFWLGLTLPVDKRPAIRTVLPLLAPACILARQVADLGIDHLHSHTCSNSAILAMMVKRILGTPFSMTLNANIEWWGGAMREKFADAEFTVAITQWLLDQIHRDYPELKPTQALLGRIGVDTVRWTPADNAHEKSNRPISVMSVGRLHASKGHDVLVRAIHLLSQRGKRATLRLAGSGPELEKLQTLTKELGLSEQVEFLGSLSEEQIIEELRDADVFALASHAEPLGVVYMEAMALGIATIGTAAGGVGEIIQDRDNGLLVPPGDAEKLADAIQELMENKILRQNLAHAGRARIVRCFDSRLGAATLYRRFFGHDVKQNTANARVMLG